jgi:hypothetical protein
MYFAWSETFRPWVTNKAFESYELLVAQNNIVGLVPRVWLENAFPSLRLGDTADFNHFWFYSFLAFLVSKILAFTGVANTPHQSFLALHFLLLLCTSITAFHLYKFRGLLAMILMTIASPILWYFDKVHTELFTYCTVLMAIIFLYDKRYLAGAFMLSIAATQNPSFALISFVPFFYRLVILRDNKFSFFEVLLVIGTALAVLAHPVYYFFRFGVLTPQLLAGGASLGGNLSNFYIWLIDPDLGLLTNWPIGIVLLLCGVVVRILNINQSNSSGNNIFYIFLFFLFLVNFYAHSSTTNLNSGATPGIARYSLWYLPGFFPLVYYVLANFSDNYYYRSVGVFILAALTILSVISNDPRLHEDYSTPTRFSSLIQTKASFLYNPPPEVFAERYSGVGESINSMQPRGVLGPDCAKLLIYPGEGRRGITTQFGCFVDTDKLQAFADSFAIGHSGGDAFYIQLEENNTDSFYIELMPGEHLLGSLKNGNIILGSGWGVPESWGVWSASNVAVLYFPCNSKQFYFNKKEILFGFLIQPFGVQNIAIQHMGNTVYQGVVSEKKTINFSVPVNECHDNKIDLVINISNPKSPLELGLSLDARQLGIGLEKFIIN